MTFFQSAAFAAGQALLGQIPGETVTLDSGVFAFGNRPDAVTWELRCPGLGIGTLISLRKPNPSLEELKRFFRSSPAWIYLGGHFSDNTLYNDASYEGKPGAIDIVFNSDHVTLMFDDIERAILKKGSADFLLDKNVRMILWGGCSVCEQRETIERIRALFNNPLILGFSDQTGPKTLNIMFGNTIYLRNGFFDRVEGKIHDIVAVRDAWMQAAKEGFAGNSFEKRFRAIDPDGQEWMLLNKAIRKNRKFP